MTNRNIDSDLGRALDPLAKNRNMEGDTMNSSVYFGKGDDSADHRIAQIISFVMHAAFILFVCWPALVLNGNAGSSQGPGLGNNADNLRVQFVSIERPSASTRKMEAEEAEPLELVREKKEENLGPIVSDALMPLEAAVSEETSTSGAPAPIAEKGLRPSQAGSPGNGDDLEARYVMSLKSAIYAQWRSSGLRHKAETCGLMIEQTAGGTVLTAQLVNCSLTPSEQRAFEAAALMAQPLPYAGFESVFLESRIIKVEIL